LNYFKSKKIEKKIKHVNLLIGREKTEKFKAISLAKIVFKN